MNKKTTLSTTICALMVLAFGMQAQKSLQRTSALAPKVKYWINLKNKNGTPYSVGTPTAFLTPASVLRRTTYGIAVNQSDLPVTPSYLAAIEAVPNVTVLYASKWLNGVVVAIDSAAVASAALSTIKTFTFVLDTSKVKRYRVNIPKPEEITGGVDPSAFRSSETTSGAKVSGFNYGGSRWQNRQLNVDSLHAHGFRGQGMTIAVLDAGFFNVNTYHTFDSVRNNGGILGARNFVEGGTDVYSAGNSNHGTMVLSCMAANKPGRILGSAPLAKYWLLKTEEGPSETLSEEYNWIRGAEFADSCGADILTTSLGYTDFNDPTQNHTYATLNGRTAPMSIASTMAARKGMFVLTAAGNEGANSWHFISVAGDADSVCTVGAIDSLGYLANFSSVGPTADGRIKPDFVARGVGAFISDGYYDGYPAQGTSFATPILAGAVACFWQANKSYNNMRLFDSLRKCATNAANPNNMIGWGVPRLNCAWPSVIWPVSVAQVSPDENFDFTAYSDHINPYVTIRLTKGNYQNISVQVFDILGRLALTTVHMANDQVFELNTSALPSAYYIVKVTTSRGTKTKKIFIE